ncbi:lactonase family protein [Photobacterium sanguinicancri]|uniref:lactonase family protein n=1 Tax=Photobacterium sanguinicancri TaxID=875932 RepID=UPI003D09D5B1
MTVNTLLHFYVGCYTDAPSTSSGIAHITLNPNSGELRRLGDVVSIRNPSYLVSTEKGLYTFSETSRNEGAMLQFISSCSSSNLPIAGDYPCHLDIKTPYLAIANYGSGNTCVFQLDETGKPQKLLSELYIDGEGPNADRQQSPHAHQATFLAHSNQLAIVDLGSDHIHLYDYDPSAISDEFPLTQSIAMPSGSGPRHLVFNQNETLAYVVCELSETLVILSKNKEKWIASHQCDLLTDTENGEAASAIRLSADERFLYVSCRAQNKICLLDVSAMVPIKLAEYDCGGRFPRDFIFSTDGKWLLVANQHSDNIVCFHRNKETGELVPTGYQCAIDAPVCLVEFIE